MSDKGIPTESSLIEIETIERCNCLVHNIGLSYAEDSTERLLLQYVESVLGKMTRIYVVGGARIEIDRILAINASLVAEAKELLKNAEFEDGYGKILTQDAEMLEAALEKAEQP